MTGPSPGIPLEQQPDDAVVRMNLWAEARGEGALGMLAVWHVVKNRAARRDTTMAQEVLRPMQFSWTIPTDPNYHKALTAYRDDPVSWAAADTVASLAETGYTTDPTHGATHYLNRAACNPRWARPENGWQKFAVIGQHEFGRAA